jgi:hypothetical protein
VFCRTASYRADRLRLFHFGILGYVGRIQHT